MESDISILFFKNNLSYMSVCNRETSFFWGVAGIYPADLCGYLVPAAFWIWTSRVSEVAVETLGGGRSEGEL